jgi:hypothetical protein
MEVARMNYYFTEHNYLNVSAGLDGPAYPRNEYLNDGNTRCGEVDLSVSNRDYDYNDYNSSLVIVNTRI